MYSVSLSVPMMVGADQLDARRAIGYVAAGMFQEEQVL